MFSAVVTGEYRRPKTALFLIACSWVGFFPHLLESSKSLFPAITLVFLLGGYGLRTVLLARKNSSEELNNSLPVDEIKKQWPSIDILIAARDEERVLKSLLERLSLVKYPKGKLSICIIDDGSSDGTSQLLNNLSNQYPNLSVIKRSRLAGGGKSGALNEALKNVHSEWLLILDADAQLQSDALERLVVFTRKNRYSAVQLRKAVINAKKNYLTIFQAMEMAMDAIIQQGRLIGDGVVELRGNGQFIERRILDKCGGFNENTITDDLDLSFRLLNAGALVSILWNPPVQEEAVESISALWKQRQRWAEGGLQRFFDYWPQLISSKLSFNKRRDLACFFLLQYALPVISFVDLIVSLAMREMPVFWPLSMVAFTISGLAYWLGCRTASEGPLLPYPRPITLLMAVLYLAHWFVVIPWVSLKMALLPKTLVWSKTVHAGQ